MKFSLHLYSFSSFQLAIHTAVLRIRFLYVAPVAAAAPPFSLAEVTILQPCKLQQSQNSRDCMPAVGGLFRCARC
jgi:hypothetical protein